MGSRGASASDRWRSRRRRAPYPWNTKGGLSPKSKMGHLWSPCPTAPHPGAMNEAPGKAQAYRPAPHQQGMVEPPPPPPCPAGNRPPARSNPPLSPRGGGNRPRCTRKRPRRHASGLSIRARQLALRMCYHPPATTGGMFDFRNLQPARVPPASPFWPRHPRVWRPGLSVLRGDGDTPL